MVEICPGIGLHIKSLQKGETFFLGDSLNQILAKLEQNLQIFGTIDFVVPENETITTQDE